VGFWDIENRECGQNARSATSRFSLADASMAPVQRQPPKLGTFRNETTQNEIMKSSKIPQTQSSCWLIQVSKEFLRIDIM
jgi:hypothetical protein